MSRVYFHSPRGEAELRGSELANMHGTVHDVAMVALPPSRDLILPRLTNPVRAWFAAKPYWQFLADVRVTFGVGGALFRDFDGAALGNFPLALNTVLAIGSDPLCLYARLAGQCEIHAYVEGPNRKWMAGLIRDGLDVGLYRNDEGWDAVVVLLESHDDEPVVTSYSGTASFPDADLLDLSEEEISALTDEGYDALWEPCLAALRADTVNVREINPDNLRATFNHGINLYDLFGRT